LRRGIGLIVHAATLQVDEQGTVASAQPRASWVGLALAAAALPVMPGLLMVQTRSKSAYRLRPASAGGADRIAGARRAAGSSRGS
jgi:hypothetical protein